MQAVHMPLNFAPSAQRAGQCSLAALTSAAQQAHASQPTISVATLFHFPDTSPFLVLVSQAAHHGVLSLSVHHGELSATIINFAALLVRSMVRGIPDEKSKSCEHAVHP